MGSFFRRQHLLLDSDLRCPRGGPRFCHVGRHLLPGDLLQDGIQAGTSNLVDAFGERILIVRDPIRVGLISTGVEARH